MQSVRKVCLLVAILAVLSVGWRTQASHAATFYVATDGDDANAGTEESPFETLERGARELKAGDTLIVKEGTYTDSLLDVIPSGTSESPVRVQAASSRTAVIQPTTQTNGIVHFGDGRQHIIFEGFTLDGNNLASFVVSIGDASFITAQDCEIKNSRNSGLLVFGHGHEFSDLDVHDNGADEFAHGLYLQGSQTRVASSSFYNHHGYGIHAFGGGGDENIFDGNLIYDNTTGGMVVTGAQNTISNNTIRNNGNGLVLAAPGSIVENNTISDSFGTSGDRGIGIVLLDSDAGVEITHNTIFPRSRG
jgi:parallel beta-helix repeat protein